MLATEGVLAASVMTSFNADVLAYASTHTLEYPRAVRMLQTNLRWTFTTATPFCVRVTQYRWRPRYDRDTPNISGFTTALSNGESADQSVPGASPFAMPWWTARFKCIGKTTKFMGPASQGGSPEVSFLETAGSTKYDFYSQQPWASHIAPRKSMFSTFYLLPQRMMGVQTSARFVPVIGTGSSWNAPVAFSIQSTLAMKWIPIIEQVPWNMSEQEPRATRNNLNTAALQHAIINPDGSYQPQFSLMPR